MAFSTMYSSDSPVRPFRMGEPVCGILESANDPDKPVAHPSSMLDGRSFATFRELLFRIHLEELFLISVFN